MRQKSKKPVPRRPAASKGDGYHHGDLRATLIATAIKMLAKISPNELSLRELARTAGVSIAAPYRHFKDKRELLAAIIEEGFELKYRYMAEAVKHAHGNPEEMYYSVGLAYFRMAAKHPQHFRLMTSSEVKPSEEFPSLMRTASKSFLLLKEMIRFAQRQGFMGGGDPYHQAMNCWCMVHGFTSLYVDDRLTWLGVGQGNAEQALKTLLSQYYNGTVNSLAKSDYGFRTFSIPEADHIKKEMFEQSNAEIEAFFKDL